MSDLSRPGPKPGPDGSRTAFVGNLRTTPAWRSWLREFADSRRMTVAAVLEAAVESHAAAAGYRKPPVR